MRLRRGVHSKTPCRGPLGQRYRDNITQCDLIEDDYSQKAKNGELYTLPRIPSVRGVDQIAHETLRKSELTKLYNQYLRPRDKPGRAIYERLMVTANGKCPFCGDIGHARTLDHFVPKANFPLYSVVPGNLVPCCRDCNSEKLNSFSASKGGQPLHPYFDDEKFFSEQWVHAKVVQTDPPLLEFSVDPPVGWIDDDKQRVTAHFVEYDLADKFGTEAAADIPETIQTRRCTLQHSTPADFSQYLQEKSDNLSLPINNWRRVMFGALARSQWFCRQLF